MPPSINGTSGDDTLNGSVGDDTINGFGGDDGITGGSGNDSILGGEGQDTIEAREGNNTIDGGGGDDNIYGADGADSILGGSGNDAVEGRDGADFIDGGDGNDYLAGFDVAGIDAAAPAGNLNPNVASDDGANDTLLGGDGDDIIFGGGGEDFIDGGADQDSIYGGDGNDAIDGGSGDDFIDGGDGDDTIDGGNGNDTIDGGDGDDTITGGVGNDIIDGGAGSDTYEIHALSTIADNTETATVVVNNDGDGTLVKTVDGTTDTVTSIETFIADEAPAENDVITINDTDVDDATFDPTGTLFARSEISALDDNSVGTFTLLDGTVINFGPGTTNAGLTGVADGLLLSQILNSVTPGISGAGTIQITSGDESGTVGNISFEGFETINFGVLCFARGTLIKVIDGEQPIETLTAGDRVLTMDGNYQEIRWIGSRSLDSIDLQVNPKLKPIIIRADALGVGFPKEDLIVSPQHRIFVRSVIAERMFGTCEVLIPANKLLALDGVDILEHTPAGVEYWHMLFDDHQIVWSNGMPAESLFTGPEAMKAVSPEGRLEIQTLFPEICEPDFRPTPARFIPEKGRQMKKLVQRHQSNSKPLLVELH